MSSQRTSDNPRKEHKIISIKTLTNSQHWQDLIEMTADGEGVICSNFCMILCFLCPLSLAAKKKLSKERLLSYRQYRFGLSFSQKDKSNDIKHTKHS
jgi:hypothetical protein